MALTAELTVWPVQLLQTSQTPSLTYFLSPAWLQLHHHQRRTSKFLDLYFKNKPNDMYWRDSVNLQLPTLSVWPAWPSPSPTPPAWSLWRLWPGWPAAPKQCFKQEDKSLELCRSLLETVVYIVGEAQIKLSLHQHPFGPSLLWHLQIRTHFDQGIKLKIIVLVLLHSTGNIIVIVTYF